MPVSDFLGLDAPQVWDTDLAFQQINGWRGETDTVEKMQHRVEHDMHTIRNWSVWLDVKIVLLTLVRGFVSPGAY